MILTPKKIRLLLGMTQKEMADYLGINEQSYANREKGRTEFRFHEVKEMCQLAKVPIDRVEV